MTTPIILEACGHRIAVLEYNQDKPGIPIVFIHGITGTIYGWDTWMPESIRHERHWYSLSLPGHYPAVAPEDFTIDAHIIAEILLDSLNQLVGNTPAILMGHSTGGFAILDMAAHKPDIAVQLISICGFAHGRWTGILGMNQDNARRGPIGRAIFYGGYRLSQLSSTISGVFLKYYFDDIRQAKAQPEYKHYVELSHSMGFRYLDLRTMATYFRCMPDIDISPLLKNITVPVVAINTDHDPIVPPGQSVLIAESVPDGEVLTINEAGHMPMIEQPERFRAIIDSILMR